MTGDVERIILLDTVLLRSVLAIYIVALRMDGVELDRNSVAKVVLITALVSTDYSTRE